MNVLARRYAINPKTVAKWKKLNFTHDARMGPKEPRSTVLAPEGSRCVAFRKHTLLPLDDCLYALQSSIPTLTRSSLHRLFQRHDISRLPEVEGEKPARKKFAQYPIGYFHIDIAEVRTEEGKLYLFVAIDRTSKFAYAELLPKYGKMEAAQFLRNLIAAVPYKIHTILTDNGIPFTHRKTDRHAFLHIFDPVCLACLPDAEPIYRLMTTLLDSTAAPAQELAALYQSHWTIETTFAEMKTTLKGADVILRSKTPEQVRQEFWGLLLAHHVVRKLMLEAALIRGNRPMD